jgi:hypothetical protein
MLVLSTLLLSLSAADAAPAIGAAAKNSPAPKIGRPVEIVPPATKGTIRSYAQLERDPEVRRRMTRLRSIEVEKRTGRMGAVAIVWEVWGDKPWEKFTLTSPLGTRELYAVGEHLIGMHVPDPLLGTRWVLRRKTTGGVEAVTGWKYVSVPEGDAVLKHWRATEESLRGAREALGLD